MPSQSKTRRLMKRKEIIRSFRNASILLARGVEPFSMTGLKIAILNQSEIILSPHQQGA
jgi:hypothetical protein